MHSKVKFPIKLVKWSLSYLSIGEDLQLESPILLQEENGPCPLIALCNTLILQTDSILHQSFINDTEKNETKVQAVLELKQLLVNKYHSTAFIQLDEILSNLGDLLLVFAENTSFQFEVDQLLEELPKLHTGLDVNPELTSGDFEPDLATRLFSIFDLKFKHGWVINQINDVDNLNQLRQDRVSDEDSEVDNYSELVELFNQLKTYDNLQEYLLSSGNDAETQPQTLVKKWLDLNKTQLTSYGLQKLNYLSDGEFIIFFRNNHFNTLFKKSTDEFYLVVTDSSFINKSSKIIWQSLNSVTGKDDIFFTGDFVPILDIDDTPEDQSDYLLSKQLQEEEDRKLAKKLENASRKKKNPPTLQAKSKSTSVKTSEKKKKSVCCIV